MKKLINTAFIYAIAAMAGGVFYREFTKLNGFTGKTTLSVVHTHLFLLGMLFFLVVLLLSKQFSLTTHRSFNKFFWLYNVGVVITTGAFVWRGVTQTLSISLSSGMDAAISGVAGIGHILTGAGMIWFFLILRKRALKK
ncbi:DUF2871 domain-containing protein [Zongyangia hominis]|uniref:DUF2871 domain-containing protein n=1 Tax=Zongyangia hominis TaxID=2763677 RepID=A0A926EEV4_9FIRM|nr:DUF2871 domain-containing protein [Zongyangia hominis]MBC8571174.1 DUF2871 domain-containing protein [Zongyangia hominis]